MRILKDVLVYQRDRLSLMFPSRRKLFFKWLSPGEYKYFIAHPHADFGKPLLEVLNSSKAIFIHIPKGAGTSVSGEVYGGQVGHYRYKDILSLLGEEQLTNKFTFSFVRNPFSRCLSAFDFLRRGGRTVEDKRWSDANLSEYRDINHWVIDGLGKNSKKFLSYVHFKDQLSFLEDYDGNLNLDFLGRFESLEKDFSTLCQKLGLSLDLPRKNSRPAGSQLNYREVISTESKKVLEEIYERDLVKLNYEY